MISDNTWKKYLPKDYLARGRVLLAFKHFENFFHEYKLAPLTNNSYLMISGGEDSTLLLYFLNLYWKKYSVPSILELVYFNHGTRIENSDEEELIERLGQQYDFSVRFFKLGFDNFINFEKQARELRLEKMKELTNSKDTIYQAHHINDSIEWSLMQQMRSSNLKSTIGIPLKNKNIFRPFHCFTKKQIHHLSIAVNNTFIEDSSNKNNHFERNYIRNEIIPGLEKRYPQYCKHFVKRANELAKVLNSKKNHQKIIRDIFGNITVFIDGLDHDQIDTTLSHIIKNHLKLDRRTPIRKIVDQVLLTIKNSRQGPINLTNGHLIYFFPGQLMITTDHSREKIKQWDEQFKNPTTLFQWGDDFSGWGHHVSPVWVLFDQTAPCRLNSLKSAHPLFPHLFNYAFQNNLGIRTYNYFKNRLGKRSEAFNENLFTIL